MFDILEKEWATLEWKLEHNGQDWEITGNVRAFVIGIQNYEQSSLMAYVFLRQHATDLQAEVIEDIFRITAKAPFYYENKAFIYLEDRSLLPLFGFEERENLAV